MISAGFVIGINSYHPDAAVALIRDGELVWAAEEERFSRIKHASGFPVLALKACLSENNLLPHQIDAVAISRNPKAHIWRKAGFVLTRKPNPGFLFDRLKAQKKANRFEEDFFTAVNTSPSSLKARFYNVEHHHAHVASSFYLSGFEKSAFLTIDGLGDFSSAMWGVGVGNEIRVMDQVFFPHSAGFLYTAGTQYLGFHSFGDEYKVMGLAAYGKPTYIEHLRDMFKLKPNGSFELNLSYFVHHKGQAKVRWSGGAPQQDILYSEKWDHVLGPARKKEDPVSQKEKDIASSIQLALEEIYFHMLARLFEKTREENLCLAGGVAYNSVANGKITQKTPFKNVYIQPAAGDAGTAIGAAFYVYNGILGHSRKFTMTHALTGPSFTDEVIEKKLDQAGLDFEKLGEEELLKITAQNIADGKVIGWFQGKLEVGPRALGNRSILADPRRADMRDILNQRIKNRETFRPFAPAVHSTRAEEFFEMRGQEAPFMLKVFPVKEVRRAEIPAVTHVDGTARVQTVTPESNPLFWKLIEAFDKITGIPILLNTSFNESEPIVCTPEDAIQCYLKTKMDMLVIGSFVVTRK